MEDLLNQLKNLQAVDWLIICTAVIAYIPLWIAIAKDKEHGAGQNFYTWILWFILDISQLTSTMLAHGTYVMFLAFAPCCLATLLIVRKHRKPIDPFEKAAVVLTILCIPTWACMGEIWAIVIQTTAQVIAGLPLLRDTWREPAKFKKTLFPLSIFTVVHLISFYRKSGWTIEDTLFPFVMLIFTLLSMLPIVKVVYEEQKKKIYPWI